MASLRYAEALGLDIPEANTATEIHLEIIYKIYICLSIYVYLYICWLEGTWITWGASQIVGRFNKNAPVTLPASPYLFNSWDPSHQPTREFICGFP